MKIDLWVCPRNPFDMRAALPIRMVKTCVKESCRKRKITYNGHKIKSELFHFSVNNRTLEVDSIKVKLQHQIDFCAGFSRNYAKHHYSVEKVSKVCIRRKYINNSIFETVRGETFTNNPRQPKTNKMKVKNFSNLRWVKSWERTKWLTCRQIFEPAKKKIYKILRCHKARGYAEIKNGIFDERFFFGTHISENHIKSINNYKYAEIIAS